MKLAWLVSILSLTVTRNSARTTEASVVAGGGQKGTLANETEADIAEITATKAAATVNVGPVTDSSTIAGPVTNETAKDRITSGPLTDSNVTPGPVTDKNVSTGQLPDKDITPGSVSGGSATNSNAANGSVIDNSVTTGPVTDNNITTGIVTSGPITDANVTSELVTDNNLTIALVLTMSNGSLLDGNFTNGPFTDGSVASGSVTDGNVTDGNTTAGQVADGNATTGPATDLNAMSTGNITDPASASAISTDLCDVRAGEQCQRKLFNLMSNVIGFSRLSSSARVLLPTICQDYNSTLRPCLTASLQGCDAERGLNSAMVISAMDFVCLTPEGLTAVTDALPCYSNRSTRRDTAFCQQLTTRSLLFNLGVCGATVTYVNCLANVYKVHCGAVASQAIQTILYKSTEPLRQLLLCPAIVTTPTPVNVPTPSTNGTAAGPVTSSPLSPAAPVASPRNVSALNLRCYQCDSGDVIMDRARFDKNCVDGELGREYLSPLPLPCHAPCYTRVRGTRTGGVARGCAAGLEAEFPGGVLPPLGCHRLAGGDWFCLCNTPRCNRHDVERYVTFELP